MFTLVSEGCKVDICVMNNTQGNIKMPFNEESFLRLQGMYSGVRDENVQLTVDKPYNLTINEIHGKYRYNSDTDNLIFEKGDFWLQEIILKRFFEKIMN